MPSARGKLIPQSLRVTSNTLKSNPKRSDSEDSMSSGLESLTEEDAKEGEADDDEGLPVYPYGSVNTASSNPVPDNERLICRQQSSRKTWHDED
ncbi:villin-4-like [Arachis duranensis]|uniref:Villin-4-like n=1 Tax=Arachis duranensis TaxID=130453 RepID=A0A6P5MVD5_ARADU|nr:villin-4-like [Arachis duranensis]